MLIQISGHTIRTVSDLTEASYAAGVVVVQLPDRTFVTHDGRQMEASGTGMVEFAAEAKEIGPIPAGMPIISVVSPNDKRLQINIVTLGKNGAVEYANVVKSYHAILQVAGENGLDSFVMPPLGTKGYGNLTPEESARALKFSLKRYTAEHGAGLDVFIACADPKVLSAFEEALQPNKNVQSVLTRMAAIKTSFMAVAAGGGAALGVGAGYAVASNVSAGWGHTLIYYAIMATGGGLYAAKKYYDGSEYSIDIKELMLPGLKGSAMAVGLAGVAAIPGCVANNSKLDEARAALEQKYEPSMQYIRAELQHENAELMKGCEAMPCQVVRGDDGRIEVINLQDKYAGKVLTFDFTRAEPVTMIGQPLDLSSYNPVEGQKAAPAQP